MNDEVSKNVLDLINTTEYEDIRKYRNKLVHKQARIDYLADEDRIKSMIILLYNRISTILSEILKEFIEQENIEISDRSIKDINFITKEVSI